MCRNGIDGSGRRCPAQDEPGYREKMNARRRARYAARKQGEGAVTTPGLGSGFADVHLSRAEFVPGSEGFEAYKTSSEDFFSKVATPGFDAVARKELFESDDVAEGKIDLFDDDWSTFDERAAVEFYTHSGYTMVKEFLSPTIMFGPNAGELKPVKDSLSSNEKEIEGVVAKVDSALAKAESPENPRLVYRGISLGLDKGDFSSWMKENYPVGGVVSDTNYLSTTFNPLIAAKDFTWRPSSDYDDRAIIFEVLSSRGAAVGVGVSAQSDAEAEVIMPRDAEFKVVSVDTDVDFKVGSFSKKATVVRLVDAS